MAIPGEGRIRGVSPDTGPWEVSPLGEGQTGRGACAPSPVSASNMPASPTPGGRCPGKVVSGRATPHSGSLFRLAPYTGPWGVSPLGEGQTGRGHAPPPLSLLSTCRHPPPQEEDTRGRPYPGEQAHTPAPSSDSPLGEGQKNTPECTMTTCSSALKSTSAKTSRASSIQPTAHRAGR